MIVAKDSVLVLSLTVNRSYNEQIVDNFSSGVYEFGSQTLTESGIYIKTFTSLEGCDSVVNLELTVLTNINEDEQASIRIHSIFVVGLLYNRNKFRKGIYHHKHRKW